MISISAAVVSSRLSKEREGRFASFEQWMFLASRDCAYRTGAVIDV